MISLSISNNFEQNSMQNVDSVHFRQNPIISEIWYYTNYFSCRYESEHRFWTPKENETEALIDYVSWTFTIKIQLEFVLTFLDRENFWYNYTYSRNIYVIYKIFFLYFNELSFEIKLLWKSPETVSFRLKYYIDLFF